jgi:hypothetical protein
MANNMKLSVVAINSILLNVCPFQAFIAYIGNDNLYRNKCVNLISASKNFPKSSHA